MPYAPPVADAAPAPATEYVPAAGQAVLRFPRISRTTWFRLIALADSRGTFRAPTARLLRFLTFRADHTGRIEDVPGLAAAYAAANGVSRRTFWYDRKTAVALGLLRVAVTPAPGRAAVYELQMPVHAVPVGLPEDLERELGLWRDEEDDQDQDDHRVGWLREAHDTLSAALVLHTSPIRETDPSPTSYVTSPVGGSDQEEIHQVGHPARWVDQRPARRRRVPVTPNELAAAEAVLDRCQPLWREQRAGRGLPADGVAGLLPVVALALRRTTPAAVVEACTHQVRSAQSLGRVVGHRLWHLVRTTAEHGAAPTRAVPTDENGARWQAMLGARAEHARATAGARALALTAMRAALDTAEDARVPAAARAPMSAPRLSGTHRAAVARARAERRAS